MKCVLGKVVKQSGLPIFGGSSSKTQVGAVDIFAQTVGLAIFLAFRSCP